MNRRALGTLILAGLVIVATSGASGGCGGGSDGPGVSAPHVGAGGEQSAPKESEPSSAEKTPDPSHDAQPRSSKTPNEPSEPPDKGHDPCNAHIEPITVGNPIKTTLKVGPCADTPQQYGGTLQLQYATGELPNLVWHPATLIPIYSVDTTRVITATCKDAYWVAVYEAGGRDASGNVFHSTHSIFLGENGFPKKADCP